MHDLNILKKDYTMVVLTGQSQFSPKDVKKKEANETCLHCSNW